MPTLQSTSEDTRVYELCILYPFPLSQKEEQEVLKGVEEILKDADVKVVFKDVWGRRGLAYSIGGYKEGNYVIYYVECDPSKLKEIDHQLKILKGVLRHLLVKPPKHYQISSYAERFEQWKEQSKMDEERLKQEKEDKLKRQVLEKAKRQARKAEKKPEETAPKAAAPKDITEQLDKLISDDIEL